MMESDPENYPRWKYKWRWHNRGIVWHKIATEWAGKEDWMSVRKKKTTLPDMYRSVTFALDRVKLSTVHWKNRGDWKGKNVNEKSPSDLGPVDATIHTREDGPTVQLSGDSKVDCKWINGQYSVGQ